MNEAEKITTPITTLPIWRREMALAEAQRLFRLAEQDYRRREKEYWRLRDEVEQARRAEGVYKI